MSIEPDAPVLHWIIPWLERSKVRIAIFSILLFIVGIIIIQIWFTRFFSPFIFASTIIALFWIFLTIILSKMDKKSQI